MPLFDVRDHDRALYDGELRDFLPERIVDVHTHVWLDRFCAHAKEEFARTVSWPSRVALDDSIEDLVATYELLLPGRSVTPLIFSSVSEGDDIHALNDYVRSSARLMRYPALIFAHPTWSAVELDRRIRSGGFLGVKVYLSLSPAYLPRKEIRIFDFLPLHQLHVLDRGRRVVMLHIPRDGRLRDPVNIEQMLEIERSFPGVRLVIAHVGRAYCEEDVGDAFERLAGTRNMVFDFAANTNETVFAKALRAFGPERCLFGSDLPITRMRMRRVCEEGRYVNVVPRGLYGDVAGDKNMREVDPPESEKLSFFFYEELLAIKRACSALSLARADTEAVFNTNARRVLGLKR